MGRPRPRANSGSRNTPDRTTASPVSRPRSRAPQGCSCRAATGPAATPPASRLPCSSWKSRGARRRLDRRMRRPAAVVMAVAWTRPVLRTASSAAALLEVPRLLMMREEKASRKEPVSETEEGT